MGIAEKYNITPEEKEIIIEKLADRIISFVSIRAKEEMFNLFDDECIWAVDNLKDILRLKFHLDHTVSDIIVELGKIRRNYDC